jgi:hypothetical protein
MNHFSQLLNGMGAEERQELIASAEEFVRRRGDYDTCVFCGIALTDLVCDAPIGFECAQYIEPIEENLFNKKATPGRRVMDSKSEMLTCDLPVCEVCRTQGQPIFFCGTMDVSFTCGNGTCESTGGSEVFVPDLCPIHKGAPSLGSLCTSADPRDEKLGWVITKDEAVAWRQQALMLIAAGKVDKVIPFPMMAKGAPPK